MKYFLGVDGGGTSCRVRLEDEHGACLGQAEGGRANIYQDFDGAICTIIDLSQPLAQRVNISMDRIYAGIGLAGATGPQQCARVRNAGLPFAGVIVDSDGIIACLGAHQGQDGGIVIAGTGSAGLALVGGKRYNCGGHGFMLGDQGSGADLGRKALRQALLAFDGIIDQTPLTRKLLSHFNNDPIEMIEWSHGAKSKDYAEFAPIILACAKENDTIGLKLVSKTIESIQNLSATLRGYGAETIALIGGLGQALLPWMQSRNSFSSVLESPAQGAIRMARDKYLTKT